MTSCCSGSSVGSIFGIKPPHGRSEDVLIRIAAFIFFWMHYFPKYEVEETILLRCIFKKADPKSMILMVMMMIIRVSIESIETR